MKVCRRLIITLLLLPLLLGATNTSHSIFRLAFGHKKPLSEYMIGAAITTLEKSGFHQTSSVIAHELQYGDAPIWVSVSAPGDGQLELSFVQLRNGCGNNPEVFTAKEVSVKIHKEFEANFKDVIMTEEDHSNDMH